VYLLSDASSYTSGIDIPIAGIVGAWWPFLVALNVNMYNSVSGFSIPPFLKYVFVRDLTPTRRMPRKYKSSSSFISLSASCSVL
jgi:hypothetical protein